MAASGMDAARRLLDALADPDRAAIPAGAIAVVVAHPDDETIGIGAQLPRLTGVSILHVTDGAPRNMADAAALGFSSPEDYAAARRRELEAVMALADVHPEALLGPWVADQQAALNLADISRRFAALLRERGIEAIVTHAYEGGHPDHDATAFAVHAAAALLARDGAPPGIVEMPLYRAGPEGRVAQRFSDLPAGTERGRYPGRTNDPVVIAGLDPAIHSAPLSTSEAGWMPPSSGGMTTGEEGAKLDDRRSGAMPLPVSLAEEMRGIEIRLDDEAQNLKARMYAAYKSQEHVLAMFSCDTERFRIAPAYDFTALPNGGRLLYEQYPWGMTGARWLALARAAIDDLGLEAGPWR